MVLTEETSLPTVEELSVQEINVSTPYLKAASMFLGKQCETVNNVSHFLKKSNQN